MSYTLTTRVADRVLARSIMHPGPHVNVVTDASSKFMSWIFGPYVCGLLQPKASKACMINWKEQGRTWWWFHGGERV